MTSHYPPTAAPDRGAYIAALGFPILVLIGFGAGFFATESVQLISGWTNPLLGIVMFSMGLTLRPNDFSLVVRRPLPVFIGVVAQYVLMPLIALGVVALLHLPPAIAAGVVLVGCAPGGTSSNVVSYLARGDVALSVTMTAVSTLLAPIFTPLLTLWLAGQYMSLDAGAMALSIVQVVLIPVVGGIVLRLLLPRVIVTVLPILPWVSVVTISTIVAIVVSGSRQSIVESGLVVLVAVILHNGCGYLFGWLAGRATGRGASVRRTMAVEVGMQNSGLAAGLAARYMEPASALPGAVFSVWHNLSGALLAAACRSVDRRAMRRESRVGDEQ